MRLHLCVLSLGLALSGCVANWQVQDVDGDGYTPLDGDCWDSLEEPGVLGLSGPDIHPGASETWYDGFDQDCDGSDDYDQDADGWVPDEYQGLSTSNIDGSGQLPAGDCWDDPAGTPDDQQVVSSSYSDKNGTALDWSQLTAFDTNPGAADAWYDGADSDCGGEDDFDQDDDGYATDAYPDQAGEFGDDCIDGADLDPDNPAGLDDDQVNPGTTEVFYDGTDADCDANDCDADGDGYDADPEAVGYCSNDDCDDADAERYPDDSIEEIWYNGIDENCDNNDGDADGDEYWVEGYATLVAESGSGEDPLPIPSGYDGDCDDEAAGTFPGASDAWYDGVDADCAGDDDFDQDLDGYRYDAYGGSDCDDSDALINPGAIETWYDGVDQDCNGASDYDADADGYDSDAYSGDDCDDTAASVNPAAAETWYDGVDGDCDGASDYDQDGDGYDSDAYSGDDCDDTSAGVNPGATETFYDGVDSDCDGASDYDADADGYDSDAYSGSDCDDADAAINPGASETWYDGIDSDCSGGSDYDQDGDLYGSDDYYGTDCDDTDAAVNPGASESWYDGIDSDCDGLSDYDQDLDGYDSDAYSGTDCDDTDAAINPGATETWYDGVDSDCSGGSDYDQDGDGYGTDEYWGTDCDDTDAGVSPGEASDDASDNLVNNDCDDLVDEDSIVEGSLIFTEISKLSTAGGTAYVIDHSANWVEVYNTESFDIALDNWAFRACEKYGTGYGGGFTDDEPEWTDCDDIHWFAVSPDAGLVVGAGDYLVLCADDTVFDTATDCDYTYTDTSTWTGSNPDSRDYANSDWLFKDQNGITRMVFNSLIIDNVGWYYPEEGSPEWPYSILYTMVRSLTHYTVDDSEDPSYWCDADSGSIWATSPQENYGSPAAADAGCP